MMIITVFKSIFNILDINPEPFRLVLRLTPQRGNHSLSSQLIPHHLANSTHLKPCRNFLNSVILLTLNITLIALQAEDLNSNPQTILTASPAKPRPIRMHLPLICI